MRLFILIISILGLEGCATWFMTRFSSYDSRSISVETFSLFNQRENSSVSQKSWRGDWLLRRERLEVIDEELRSARPDVVILQQMMAKEGSPSDSDRNILGSGALNGYDWDVQKVRDYPDTSEEQFNAVAVGLPVTVKELPLEQKGWAIGTDGFVSVSQLSLEGDPILVFNVEMPTQDRNLSLWYSFLEEKISEVLKTSPQFCPERLIVAGTLPMAAFTTGGQAIQDRLEMKDVSEGLCEVASDCFTGTPLNEIFMVTSGSQTPSQMDRIYVHYSALVASSSVNFKTPRDNTRYGAQYGLSRLWPSQRFGWGATVRLAKCSERDPL